MKLNRLLNDSHEQSIHKVSLKGKDNWDKQGLLFMACSIKESHMQPLYDADIVLVNKVNPLYFR